MLIYFFQIFSNLQFLVVIYSFLVTTIYKWFNIWNPLRVFFNFFKNLMWLLSHIENIYHRHFLDSLLLLLFFYLVWRINIWSTSWTVSKIKSLPLIDVSKLIWFLKRSDSKISSTASFALLQCMNSILSLFECITRSSSTSFKEIKLIAFIDWIFLITDFQD